MTPKISREAQLLSIYIGETDKWRGKPLYSAIIEILRTEKIAGATVLRGVAGFGAHSHVIHTAAILRLSEDLPLLIQIVDSPEKIEQAIEIVTPMVTEGLITVQDVQVVRYTHRYLNPLPADRHVEEVMTREVVTLAPSDSVATAWQKMFDTLIKAMPVVNEDGTVAGLLTDEDLLEHVGVPQRLSVAQKLDPVLLNEENSRFLHSPLMVANVMSKPAITVKATDSLGLAAVRMAKAEIKRLPVVDESGKLVGVLSRLDILRLLTQKEAKKLTAPLGAAKSVRDVMSPTFPAVQHDDDLSAIVDALLESGSHRVIVLAADGRAAGLISDSDVIARIQPAHQRGVLAALMGAAATPPSDITAEQLMSPGVLTANPETSLIDAAMMMMGPKRKWLVVVDENDKPLGLVDRHILLRAMTSG